MKQHTSSHVYPQDLQSKEKELEKLYMFSRTRTNLIQSVEDLKEKIKSYREQISSIESTKKIRKTAVQQRLSATGRMRQHSLHPISAPFHPSLPQKTLAIIL